ncbi:hypothetical protein GQ53DRAFT_877674 [Thozetella sp. PMI_491]|nr:hypothetical protein GQ53DRAFT_877674 [Thozetella sp. PMI_491]
MDPISILSALGTSISVTKTVAETLNTLISQTKNSDRALQQLCREVTDFQSILQRMKDDFSDPTMRVAAFESQTGSVGAHWTAVLHAILKCNERLDELYRLVKDLSGSSAFTANSVLRGVRINFAASDIQYYRSEIKDYKDNIALNLQMILVCRVMDSRTAPSTAQPNLIEIEDEILRLRKEVGDIKQNPGLPGQPSVRRKPVQNSTTAAANSSTTRDEARPRLDMDTIKKRRLETAAVLEPTLNYASTLLTTASTYSAPRRSLDDDVRLQNAQSNLALRDFEVQVARSASPTGHSKAKQKESSARSALLLIPRFIASLLLFGGLLLLVGLGLVVLFFWLLVQVCTGFSRWNNDSARMKRDGRAAFDWFEERWRDIW